MKKLMKAIFRPQYNMVDMCGVCVMTTIGVAGHAIACIFFAVAVVCVSVIGELLTRNKL